MAIRVSASHTGGKRPREDNYTKLMLAIDEGATYVEEILKHGKLNVNKKSSDEHGWTALHYAACTQLMVFEF